MYWQNIQLSEKIMYRQKFHHRRKGACVGCSRRAIYVYIHDTISDFCKGIVVLNV